MSRANKQEQEAPKVRLIIEGPLFDKLKAAHSDYKRLSGHEIGLKEFAGALFLDGLNDNITANAVSEMFEVIGSLPDEMPGGAFYVH